MGTVDCKQALRVGFLGLSAGETVNCFTGGFPGPLLYGLPLNHEGLPDVREVEIAIEFCGGPYLPDLDSPMIGRTIGSKIRLLPVLEAEIDVLKERGLIPLDGEVIMAFAPHYVGGDVPLGEKGVGGDVPVFDVDGVKEGNRCPDLVGPFDLLIESCREDAYFFWV
jgi:hypothetical protein